MAVECRGDLPYYTGVGLPEGAGIHPCVNPRRALRSTCDRGPREGAGREREKIPASFLGLTAGPAAGMYRAARGRVPTLTLA